MERDKSPRSRRTPAKQRKLTPPSPSPSPPPPPARHTRAVSPGLFTRRRACHRQGCVGCSQCRPDAFVAVQTPRKAASAHGVAEGSLLLSPSPRSSVAGRRGTPHVASSPSPTPTPTRTAYTPPVPAATANGSDALTAAAAARRLLEEYYSAASRTVAQQAAQQADALMASRGVAAEAEAVRTTTAAETATTDSAFSFAFVDATPSTASPTAHPIPAVSSVATATASLSPSTTPGLDLEGGSAGSTFGTPPSSCLARSRSGGVDLELPGGRSGDCQ
jgi:hypothetical protein